MSLSKLWETVKDKESCHAAVHGASKSWTKLNSNTVHVTGIPGGSVVKKKSACKVGDSDLNHGWGRSSGEGNDNPLQYSCLGKSMDREAWQAIVHGS